MKKILCAILALAMTLGGLTVAMTEDDTRVTLICCEQQDFCTACMESFEWAWDDENGLTIWTEERGRIPYLLVYRNPNATGRDFEGYFRDEFTPEMQADYGERLIEVGDFQTYTVQGVEMPGQQYTYLVEGIPVVLLRVFDVRWGGNVCYTAKYRQDDPEATLGALAVAVHFFRDGANTYDQGPDTQPAPDADPAPGAAKINVEKTRPIVTGTSLYNDGRFSMRLPDGWKVMTTGSLAQDLIVKAWDPECPERCIFRAAKIEPVLRSQAAKAWYAQYSGLGGVMYSLYADAPALEELTVACFLTHVNDVRDYAFKYYDTGLMLDANCIPALYDAQVLESFPSKAACMPTCYDNSVARVRFNSESGAACEGLMTAQPTRIGSALLMGGVDISPDTVYEFMGFMAPQQELLELEPVLSECLSSFAFTEDFIRQSLQAAGEQYEIVRQMNDNLRAAADSCNDAWAERQTTYDVLSQQRSDATLGYDRLYDSETGEIYRAETGFWDDYVLHRYEYDNPNLQRIDESTEDYYLRGVDYTITR